MTLKTLAGAGQTDLVEGVTFDVDSVVSILAGEQRKIRAMLGVAAFLQALLPEAQDAIRRRCKFQSLGFEVSPCASSGTIWIDTGASIPRVPTGRHSMAIQNQNEQVVAVPL
jgi:hypothetical protein